MIHREVLLVRLVVGIGIWLYYYITPTMHWPFGKTVHLTNQLMLIESHMIRMSLRELNEVYTMHYSIRPEISVYLSFLSSQYILNL